MRLETPTSGNQDLCVVDLARNGSTRRVTALALTGRDGLGDVRRLVTRHEANFGSTIEVTHTLLPWPAL